MGRPRKPTHLALLAGDDKKNPDRVNRSEPMPDDLPVVPPVTMSAEVRAIWDRLAPDRIRKRVLTAWDVDAFALFCQALHIAHGNGRAAEGSYELLPGAPSPLTEFKNSVAIVAQLGSRFGWTPSDRAKLVMEGQDDKSDDSDLLTG